MRSSPRLSFSRLRSLWLLALVAPLLLGSCISTKYVQQRTMFQLTTGPDGKVDTANLRKAVNRTARNYLIHPNDLLSVQVFTNKGERLIDPNGDLNLGTPNTGIAGPARTTGGVSSSGQRPATNATSNSDYLVQADGTVKLPLLGKRVSVAGLNLLQVDSLLQHRYNEFYKETFVKTAVSNNRVTILGAPGGLVVPLTNDNMNLLEVLALAGGTDGGNVNGSGSGNSTFSRYGGRVDNIRIIRGDLKNPQIQFVNLSTIEGMRQGQLQVEPNDIIYTQPVRRPFLEGLTDAGPVFALTSTLLSSVSVIFTVIALSRRN